LLSSFKKFRNYKEALRIGFRHINTRFDLVQVNVAFPAGLFALELKKNYNLPFIILEHWTGYLSHTNSYKEYPFFLMNLHKKVFSNADKVLVVSDHLGKSLKSLGLTKEYGVFPNVVDSNYFYPSTDKKNESVLQILHVSSFDDEHKNISGMLAAIASLKRPYHLNLVTESKESVVNDFLARAGISVDNTSIKSKLAPKDVGSEMRKSDVLVLFSNYETFSVVIAEAWMCGIPAAYSQCGGLTEIDNVALGRQLDKKDERSLTIFLESFNSNDYSMQEIAKYGMAFEKRQLSDKIRDVYDQLC
jgi:glycosyltransferase involved in cell wall biosynthesis